MSSTENSTAWLSLTAETETSTTSAAEDSKQCLTDYLNSAFQIFIIIVNVAHTLILLQLRKREYSRPLTILIIMAIDDVLISFFSSLTHLCVFSIINADWCLIRAISECGHLVAIVRYFILAAACYDRFVAICQPFAYAEHHILRHITLYILLITLVLVVVHLPLVLALKRCWSFANILTEPVANGLRWFQLGFQVIELMIAVIVIIFSTAFVLRELHLMKKRQRHLPDASVLKTTHLILVTLLVFFCCLIPPIVSQFYFSSKGIYSQTRTRLMMIFDSYAVLNVVVNGVMNKSYQQQVKLCFRYVLCAFKKKNAVAATRD